MGWTTAPAALVEVDMSGYSIQQVNQAIRELGLNPASINDSRAARRALADVGELTPTQKKALPVFAWALGISEFDWARQARLSAATSAPGAVPASPTDEAAIANRRIPTRVKYDRPLPAVSRPYVNQFGAINVDLSRAGKVKSDHIVAMFNTEIVRRDPDKFIMEIVRGEDSGLWFAPLDLDACKAFLREAVRARANKASITELHRWLSGLWGRDPEVAAKLRAAELEGRTPARAATPRIDPRQALQDVLGQTPPAIAEMYDLTGDGDELVAIYGNGKVESRAIGEGPHGAQWIRASLGRLLKGRNEDLDTLRTRYLFSLDDERDILVVRGKTDSEPRFVVFSGDRKHPDFVVVNP